MSNDLLHAALEYGDQGLAIMPCVEDGKKPALDRTGKEHAIATTDTDQIRQWWTDNPKYNIGIVCWLAAAHDVAKNGPRRLRDVREGCEDVGVRHDRHALEIGKRVRVTKERCTLLPVLFRERGRGLKIYDGRSCSGG